MVLFIVEVFHLVNSETLFSNFLIQFLLSFMKKTLTEVWADNLFHAP